jgi:hypothetical protein
MARRIGTLFIGLIAAAALYAPTADARDFNCDASAFRLTLGGQATVEPVTANRGATSCKEVKSQTSQTIGPVVAGVLLAETTLPNGEAQAKGGLASLRVNADALAGLPIPTLDAIDQLPAVPVPAVGLIPAFTIDIRPAVKALVQGLQTGPLLELNGSVSTAHARCVNGRPQLSGETQTLGLKVLGETIPTDAIVNQALTLYNGQTIDPSKLDLSKIVLPPGLSVTDPLLGSLLQSAVGDALKAIPPISLPESLIQLSIKPSSQTVSDGGLTQRGLSISLGLLGQNILSTVVGEARVSNDSVTCSGVVAPLREVTKQALSCGTRRLALIDVLDRGKYVTLYGAADTRLAGKVVSIYSKADHRVVARARVSKAGLFRAKAPLPPQRYRYTNTARYLAQHGSQKSLYLKLHRRMVFTSVRSAHGKVILRGLVTRPWTSPKDTVVIRRRLTCRKNQIVARVRPDARGRFAVTLKAPKNGDVGVYRATTMVGYPGGWAPDFRTYTLPGLVRFAR